MNSNTDKESIKQLLEFFGVKNEGSTQKSLIELEKEIDKLEDEAGEARRKADLNDFAMVLHNASHTLKFEAVYQTINYFSQFDFKDFTIVPVVLEKLDAYKGKEALSDSDIVAMRNGYKNRVRWLQ